MMETNKNIAEYSLNIGWLYPDLMSIYGDRGNIITLQKRCEARGIKVVIKNISLQSPISELKTSDLFFMGGSQDSQQTIVSADLKKEKGGVLAEMIEQGIPGLYICGAYQLLGKYYKEANGLIIDGLGIFDIYTENPGLNHKRFMGNVTANLNKELFSDYGDSNSLVGFENHGGHTYLGKNIKPLGEVIKGFGNNGEDRTEGAVYKNSIGSYFHGPILPKNPYLADFLIAKALEKKYGHPIKLEKLNDTLSSQAHDNMLKNL
jgi:CobQ-like glutamine amidotransferase family enzyme